MWASGEANITVVDPAFPTGNSSSSSSSSKKLLPSSNTSSSSSLLQLPSQTRKTMEELWKDISLSSLHERPTRSEILTVDVDHGPKSRATIGLQDFLARPFHHPPSSNDSLLLFGPSSSPSPPSRPLPVPTTALSLNSGPPEFPTLDALPTFHTSSPPPPPPNSNNNNNNNSDYHHCFPNAASGSFSFMADTPRTSAFDAFASSPPAFSSLCNKKRLGPDSQENSGDRRHKRMIKNRESAARSRARKQAWSLLPQISNPNLGRQWIGFSIYL
ncbi:hypothetical protein ACLOJK_025765 [Asimina triloba]